MELGFRGDMQPGAGLEANSLARMTLKVPRSVMKFECYDKDGKLKWVEEVPNTVFDAGINDLLTQYFKGSAYTATWFVGLVDNTSFTAYAAGDTSAAHGGWIENQGYSNATRPGLTLGAVAAKSVDNSTAKAVFNINASVTLRGAFIITNSAKGGATGILYGAADFTGGNRACISGDTLNVTITLTGA